MWPLVAAVLNVAPVLIHLSHERPSALVALKNEGADAVRVQLTVHAWQEGPEGQIMLQPTSELELFPPLLQLAPGEKRNIRVGTTARTGARERSYRLVIDELPSPLPPGRGLQIPTLTRLSLPVFLEPAARVVQASVTGMSLRGGRLSFELANAGTVHVRPSSVQVRAADAAGATVLEQRWDGWYLLPGGVRRYELRIAPADCARIANVFVDAPGEEGAISSSWRPPTGGCGR